MQTQTEKSKKVYWILDGEEKTFMKRDTIKKLGGYFVPDHKAWCIDNPKPETIDFLKVMGLTVQFRRFQAV